MLFSGCTKERAEQRNPRTYWNTGKLTQNDIIITGNNRRLRIVGDNDQKLKRFFPNAVVCFCKFHVIDGQNARDQITCFPFIRSGSLNEAGCVQVLHA